MHPVVFSRSWFARHQRTLLMLLAMPVIGRELRDVLAIRRCDVGYDRRIVALAPHYYVVQNPDGTLTADVRTHAKYAKRIRYQLDGLWRAAHGWDRFVANPLCPALNVGFDTLTVFPDPDPENTSVDGTVLRGGVNESFASIRTGGGNGSVSNGTSGVAVRLVATATTDQFEINQRGVYLFDTSVLGAGVVTAADLSLSGRNKSNAIGSPDVHVAGSTPASSTALVDADYNQCQTTSFGSVTYAAWPTDNSYAVVSLNASGVANIVAGVSKFSSQMSWDIHNSFAGTWVSSQESALGTFFADEAGSTVDPKLVVTFTTDAEALITLLGTAPV
jgi:hypothetical protein